MKKIYKNASWDATKICFGFKYLLFVSCMLMAGSVWGQTTLISPTGDGGFENGTTFAANGWTVVASSPSFYIGSPTPASAGTNCAYISTASGAWTAATSAGVTHIYKDVTIPAGETSLTLSLKYKTLAVDAGYDFLKIHVVPINTLPVAGTQLSTGQLGANTDGTTSYATYTFTGTVSTGSQRIVISFKNDGVTPYGAAAIDEISLTSSAPASYTWNATTGTAAWATASNWTPARTTPNSSDILNFSNGGSSIVQTTTGAVGGNIVFSNNTAANFQPTTANTLTLSSLNIPSGSSMFLNGTTAQTLAFNSGAVNTIGGRLEVSGAAHSVSFANSVTTVTSTGTLAAGGATSATLTGTTTTLIINGTYEHKYTTVAGALPTATWADGSNCNIIGYTTVTSHPSYAQSFWNFTWNCPSQTAAITGSITGSWIVRNNLNLVSTGTTGTFTNSGTSTYAINNIVMSGGTFNLASSTATYNITGNFTKTAGTMTPTGNCVFNFANTTTAQNLSLDALASNPSTWRFSNPLGVTITGTSSFPTAFPIGNGTSGGLRISTTASSPITFAGTITNGFAYNAANSTLTYDATGSYTARATEFPATSGPASLTINVGSGNVLSMPFSRTISNTLTMTSGDIDISSYTLTLGTSSSVLGTLTWTAGNIRVTTGSVTRWFGTTGLPTAAGTAIGYFPLASSSNNRNVSIYFSAATALSTAGTITVGHNNVGAISTIASVVDGAYTINTRTNSNWPITTGNGIAGAGSIGVRLTGGGAFNTGTVANLRLMQASAVTGTHVAGTGTTPNFQASRSGFTLAQLANTHYIGAASADMQLVFNSVASGNWNNPSTWDAGSVPTCTGIVNILNGHNVTVNSAGNQASTTTINTGATLTVASGDVTVGCTNNNTTLTNNGTLTVTGGTLNVNGNYLGNTGSTLNQSGGDMNVDGNAAGNTTNSVASGTHIFNHTASAISNLNLTGGRITIVDPHANTSSSDYCLRISQGGAYNSASSNHTFRFGNGVSNDNGGNSTYGFYYYLYPGSFYYGLGSIEINAGTIGTNRFVYNGTTYLTGNINIVSGELRQSGSSITCPGDITNNGIFTNGTTLTLGLYNGTTTIASPNPQTIGGTGTYRNASISPTANITSITINNSNATGVTLNTPISVSSTLTMTSGIINTSSANLLTLGTTTVSGTLSGTPSNTNYINGPFARTFAASRIASGTYDNTTLFPVGKGSDYAPIYVDPTSTSLGAVIMSSEYFATNSGTGGAGVSNLSNGNWSVQATSGSSNLTSANIRYSNSNVVSSSKILVSTASNGTYNGISGGSTNSGANPNILLTSLSSYTSFPGYFAYGDLVACNAPVDAASNLVASNKTSTSYTATFDPAPSGATGYLVVRYTGTFTPTTPVDGTIYSTGSFLGGTVVGNYYSAPFTFSQTGLTAGTTYTYKIYSFNNSSCAGPVYYTTSYDPTVTTCPSTISTAPTSSAATSILTNSFQANWTAVSGWTPSNYILDVATDASFTSFVSGYNALNVGNVTSYIVTGLGSGTTYYYRVRATDGSCTTPNSSSQSPATLAITSIASGNWNATTTWNSGAVPTCTDNVTIANTHNVTVNSSSNVSKNLTIASGGTLTVASGDLTVGCTLNNTPLTNNGTLTVSGGTLNVNGNIVCASGSTFNQSGGDINIDGNNSGSTATSATSYHLSLANAVNWTGGTLTIVDPHANTSATDVLYYNTSSSSNVSSAHTLKFGNGVSTDAGGNAIGFKANTYVGSGRINYGNLIINGGTGINRIVTGGSWSNVVLGDLTINSNSEYAPGTTVSVAGNIVNNGTYTQTSTTSLQGYSGTSSSATTNAQTISGSGTFRNATTSPSANLTSLTVNNTSTAGVTLNVPLSVSGTLTMTAGKINTTTTNLLSLGTTTTAGTLSYTAGQIVGPFARTFAASRTASGTYDNTTLFPVGDGTYYIPIHIDPTTTSGGVVIMRGQAFNTNSGSGGAGVASTLSSDRWEALITSGSSNLSNCFIGLNDAQIAAGNIIAQATSASGIYNTITPTSTVSTNASIRTATAIAAADYTGYFTYAAPGPRITSFTPTTACPNAATTITITGTNLGSATSVTLNGEACTIVTNTATQIVATTDASPQAGNIVVTTAVNSATSTSAMSLFTLPTVTASSNATSNTVCSGTSVTLNGGGASSYSWDNSVTDNTAFTPTTSTNYTVTGTDANGCKNTATISITVNQIIAITTQPSNQVVLPNANANFTVAATGTGLTYQWEESTDNGNTWSPITNGGVYSGATTNSLLLTSVNSSYNNYQYRVVINGTAPCNAETSNAATLTLSNTAISAHPQNETICSSNGTANFSITTTGTVPFYQWQISLDNGVSWNDIPGENNTTLSLSGLTISNSLEQYRCQLDFGAINSNAAILTVYDPPLIGTQPSNLTVCSNATTGFFSVSASGSNLTYQWQVSTDAGSSWNNVSGSNVSGATSASLSFSSYTNAMNGNQYRVVVSGSSPCTSVTSNVVTLNVTGISVSASASTVCQNSPVTFTITPTSGSPSLSYSWTSSTGSGASTAVTANPASITPTASGSYTYTLATTGGGCTFSNTASLTVNSIPSITKATATPATICSGEALTLTGESIPSSAGSSTSSGAGTGFTSSTGYPTFFGNYWYQDWSQILYTASELTSMGLVSGNITALRINVGALPSPTTINGYSIRLGSTSNTSVSGFQTSGLTTVFNPGNYTVASTGNVTVNFSTPYFWDGISGIIVDIRGTGQYASANATINATSTVQNTVASAYTSSNNTNFWTSSPAPTLSKLRPNIVFNGQVGTNQTSNFSWSWNSSPALSAATGTTTETNNGASATTKTYTVTATNASTGCSNTATTSAVTINPATIAPTATNSSQCGSATPTCSVSGSGTAGNTFRWYTAATGGSAIAGQTAATLSTYPVSTTSSFYISESNGTCESPRTQVDVTVSTPPSITVAATVNPVCSGSATSLSASSANTGYTYAWSNGLGSGANVSASPTANTTYTVTATDNSGGTNNGCATTGSILVTTNPVPSSLTLSPSTTTGVCGGSSQTLSLTSGGTMPQNNVVFLSTSSTISTGTNGQIFRTGAASNTTQAIYSASELLAMGLKAGDNITAVSYETTVAGSPINLSTLNISTAWVTDSFFTNTTFVTGLTSQSTNSNVSTSPSVKKFSLSVPPVWNGSSHLLIQAVTSTTSASSSATERALPIKSNTTLSSTSSTLTGTLNSQRPYIMLDFNSVQPITWSPTTDLYTDAATTTAYTGTAATTLYAKPTANRTYTATATIASTGCTNTKTVQLNNRIPANNVVLASSTKTGAVEQCTDANGWTYYGTAANPDEWLFGIYKNGSNFTATVDISVDNVNKFRKNTSSNGANQEHASYIMSRNWNVNATGTVGSGVKVRFFIDPQDITDLLDERDNDYDVLKNTTNPNTLAVTGGFEWFKTVGTTYNPSNWTGNKHNGAIVKLTEDAVGTINGQTYVELSGITSFSGGSGGTSFGPSSNGLFNNGGTVGLPVTWKDVKATAKENGNLVQWSTSSEKNTKSFVVEYSYDAKEFFEASKEILAAGNSTTDKFYEFNHSEEYGEMVYYRIRQMDLDGKVDYSKTVVVKRTSKLPEFHVSMYPVPLNVSDLTLRIQTIQKNDISISINDLLGRGVYSETISPSGYTTDHKIDLSHLTQGTYHVTINNGTNKTVQVLVVGK